MAINKQRKDYFNEEIIGTSLKLRKTYGNSSWTLDEGTESMYIIFSSMGQLPNYFDEKLILNTEPDLFYLSGIDSSRKVMPLFSDINQCRFVFSFN